LPVDERGGVSFDALRGATSKATDLVSIMWGNNEIGTMHPISEIAELLHNGATLPEVMELARHSDVRMTMKYAHIGIGDQAKALALLPTPWQGIGGDCAGARGHSGVLDDSDCHAEGAGTKSRSPVKNGAFDSFCQSKSAGAEIDQEWRRRELNPRPAIRPRMRLHV